MAHYQPKTGSRTMSDSTSSDAVQPTRPRPMHKFLQEWRIITRHPELDRVRNQELRWSQSLDGRVS